jgi:hypothetical protein
VLSKVYEGQIFHGRSTPKHAMNYPVWFAYLHLDEIEEFCKLSVFCDYRKNNLLSFFEEDFLYGNRNLGSSIRNRIFESSGKKFEGEIFLLTTFRQLGYSMNPISLFYCFNPSNELLHIVADVHNTPWNERHNYVLDVSEGNRVIHVKNFHVSPFMPMNLSYDWDFSLPGDEIKVRIRVLQQNEPVMSARLELKSLPASSQTINRMLFNHTWQPLKTTARIYLNAAALWIKGAKFFPHPKKKEVS